MDEKSFSSIQLANPQYAVYLPFQKGEPLRRREREHPANQRQIDAVFTVIRQRLFVRAHTNIVPPLPEVLHLLVGSIQTSRLQEGQTRPNQPRLYSLPDHSGAGIRALNVADVRRIEVWKITHAN